MKLKRGISTSLTVLGLVLLATSVEAQSGYGQVTMENRTSATLDLYVDGGYGCRALRGLFCTTQVRAGPHTITAKATDGRETSTQIELRAGESLTWTVTEN